MPDLHVYDEGGYYDTADARQLGEAFESADSSTDSDDSAPSPDSDDLDLTTPTPPPKCSPNPSRRVLVQLRIPFQSVASSTKKKKAVHLPACRWSRSRFATIRMNLPSFVPAGKREFCIPFVTHNGTMHFTAGR